MCSVRQRFGRGALDQEDRSASQYSLCCRFLEVVQKKYPKVFEDLVKRAPGRAALKRRVLARAKMFLDPDPQRPVAAADVIDPYPQRPVELARWRAKNAVFVEIATKWARANRLNSKLVVIAAAHTLNEWAEDPTLKRNRQWRFGEAWNPSPRSRLSPIFPDTLNEDYEDGWLRRAKRLWKDRERELKACGMAAPYDTELERLEWLARFQVGEEHWEDITPQDGTSLSIDAVRNAISRHARLICLPLRKLPRGGARRRKAANSDQPDRR